MHFWQFCYLIKGISFIITVLNKLLISIRINSNLFEFFKNIKCKMQDLFLTPSIHKNNKKWQHGNSIHQIKLYLNSNHALFLQKKEKKVVNDFAPSTSFQVSNLCIAFDLNVDLEFDLKSPHYFIFFSACNLLE